MNIKTREKKKEGEDEGPKKITKLGIGVPGGAKMNLKEWDYFTQIKCLACKKDLDDSELTNDIKKKIL